MANTLNIAKTAIASKALEVFNSKIAPLAGVFSTDFSKEVAKDMVMTTRVVPAMGAAVDFSTVTGRNDANVSGDIATELVTVNLKHYLKGFSLTDQQVSDLETGSPDTKEKLISKCAHSVAKGIFDDAMALVTQANYGNVASNVASTSFTYDTVCDLKEVASDLGWDEASIVLNSKYVTALRKDDAIAGQLGSAIVESGKIGKVAGFDVVEAPVPENSENLKGFICTPDSMVICARMPDVSNDGNLAIYEPTFEKASGLPMLIHGFRDANTGKLTVTLEVIAGVAVGVKTALKRVATA